MSTQVEVVPEIWGVILGETLLMGTLFNDLCKLQNTDANNSVFATKPIIFNLKHELVIFGFAFISKKTEII